MVTMMKNRLYTLTDNWNFNEKIEIIGSIINHFSSILYNQTICDNNIDS